MSGLQICRACLSPTATLLRATQSYIDEFVNLTKLSFQQADGKPGHFCPMCCRHLRKCYRFRRLCQQANDILNKLGTSDDVLFHSAYLSLGNLNPELVTSKQATIELIPGPETIQPKEFDLELKYEEFDIKHEPVEDRSDSWNIDEAKFDSNDEDDDIPLNSFKVVKEESGESGEIYKNKSRENGSAVSRRKANKLNVSTKSLQFKETDLNSFEDTENYNVSRKSKRITAIKTEEQTKETVKKRQFICCICEKQFQKQRLLKSHVASHVGENCPICDKILPEVSALKRHMQRHVIGRPHQCSVCGKLFKHSCNLKYHMTSHTGEKPHQCTVCSKRFGTRSLLTKHLRTHTGQLPYSCSICHRRFSQGCHLKRHFRIHTGVRPFECSECSKRFRDNVDLKSHMRIHTGERPYKCALCEKTYKHSNHLRYHMRTTHNGVKPPRETMKSVCV